MVGLHRPRASLLLLAGGAACALRGAIWQPQQQPEGAAFVAPLAGARTPPGGAAPPAAALRVAGAAAAAGVASGGGASLAAGALAAAALAVAAVARGSRVACQANRTIQKKWWITPEERPALEIPKWQRDYGYGWRFLRLTLWEAKRKGQHVFWDVRVVSQSEAGSEIEMVNSGVEGFIPRKHEGFAFDSPERLVVGQDYKALCIACPTDRVRKEKKHSRWPRAMDNRMWTPQPIFSHWMWKQEEARKAFAPTVEAGTIIEGTVRQQVRKGLLIELAGADVGKPAGMLAKEDVSRLQASDTYMLRQFPAGTKIKCYVCHSDKKSGRITLSTKEFEDDDHIGWMLHFPAYCMKNAEKAVERYHRKRAAYIEKLQR